MLQRLLQDLGADLAPASASTDLRLSFYVLLSRSWTRRARLRCSEQKSPRRKVSAAGEASEGCCQPSPPRAGLAPGTSVRRSWGITTGCATTGRGGLIECLKFAARLRGTSFIRPLQGTQGGVGSGPPTPPPFPRSLGKGPVAQRQAVRVRQAAGPPR